MRIYSLWFGICLLGSSVSLAAEPEKPFGIRVVDNVSERGVPLVELRTVNDISMTTDSAGWVAFNEPGLMDREVYFAVSGPGIEHAADGFGFRGVRLRTTPGKTVTVKVKRTSIAERMYRVTGQGIYRDSELLGQPIPKGQSNLNGGVLGQDSVQAIAYRGKVFWLWGDTNLAGYPLGNFHVTAATSPLPGKSGFRPNEGIPLRYFMDKEKPDRVRRMAALAEPGLVWLFGLLTVSDEKGQDNVLLAHFTRRKSLTEELEQGIMRFDDEAGIFRRAAQLDLKELWRYPKGNAFAVRESGELYYYFAAPLAYTRVKATAADVLDPRKYEVFTFDREKGYLWKRDGTPTTQADEQKLLQQGKLKPEQARYLIVDALRKKSVLLHTASINYNSYRKKWILIGLQQGGKDAPSYLGEVWYAEAESPTGPWHKAVKVASHPKYSFYNVRQHTFLDEQNGKVVYFEGTYTKMFSGTETATPRYEYNQILYRVDLSDRRLKLPDLKEEKMEY